jgi:hypothetical protein
MLTGASSGIARVLRQHFLISLSSSCDHEDPKISRLLLATAQSADRRCTGCAPASDGRPCAAVYASHALVDAVCLILIPWHPPPPPPPPPPPRSSSACLTTIHTWTARDSGSTTIFTRVSRTRRSRTKAPVAVTMTDNSPRRLAQVGHFRAQAHLLPGSSRRMSPRRPHSRRCVTDIRRTYGRRWVHGDALAWLLID